ncbi:MAG: hypothetical protein AAGI37_06185 [Planctomycetota bacterium]
MHNLIRLYVLLGFVLISGVAIAGTVEQEQADDIEDAKTPSTIVDLLPQEGESPIVSEFWVMAENNGGENQKFENYLRWSFKRTPDGYTIETMSSSHGDRHERDRLTFDKAGKLTGFQYIEWSATYKKTVVGYIDGDLWVTAYRSGDSAHNLDGLGWAGAELRVKQYAANEQLGLGLPIQCAPLVVAYHIRHSNLGYELPWVRNVTGRFKIKGDTVVEAVGQEQIQHAGQAVESHVLKIASGKPGTDIFDENNRYAVQMVGSFLPDGSLIGLRIKGAGGYKQTAQWATREEVVKKFKLDLGAVPELPVLPGE